MPKENSPELDNRIRELYKHLGSYRKVIAQLKMQGEVVSVGFISKVINNVGIKRKSIAEGSEVQRYKRHRTARTSEAIAKVKKIMKNANPIPQPLMAKKLNISQRSVGRIIHQDLRLETRKKTKVHVLSDAHKANRKINCRKLYDRHLSGSKYEFVVTLDEAYIYLNYCNGKREICYVERGEKVPEDWVKEQRELHPVGFMLVGAICGRGPIKLIRVPKNVKVNAQYYIDSVLKPILEIEIPKLYPKEMHKVYLHHDKATSHTAKKTQDYLSDLNRRTGINFIKKGETPVKSPDCSPLDFFGFGYLKQKLFHKKPKTENGLWKACQDVWSTITPEMAKLVFESWKRRCRAITKANGSHIEQTKKIHRRRINFNLDN